MIEVKEDEVKKESDSFVLEIPKLHLKTITVKVTGMSPLIMERGWMLVPDGYGHFKWERPKMRK